MSKTAPAEATPVVLVLPALDDETEKCAQGLLTQTQGVEGKRIRILGEHRLDRMLASPVRQLEVVGLAVSPHHEAQEQDLSPQSWPLPGALRR
ncbi:hypothetical protein AB0C47_21260 [Micromonospora taraxaci]